MPPDQVQTLASELIAGKDLEVIVYSAGPTCDYSKRMAEELTAMGYTEVRHYMGGKSDWMKAGLPIASKDKAA